jgi:hypothetical protein
VARAPGLAEVVYGQAPFKNALNRISSSLGEFDMLTAGNEVGPEALSGGRMHALLDYARLSYDFIVLDGPSFPLVSDALLLAQAADRVLSVLRLQHTPRRLAAEHMERLAAAATSYGVVVNCVPDIASYGYGNYTGRGRSGGRSAGRSSTAPLSGMLEPAPQVSKARRVLPAALALALFMMAGGAVLAVAGAEGTSAAGCASDVLTRPLSAVTTAHTVKGKDQPAVEDTDEATLPERREAVVVGDARGTPDASVGEPATPAAAVDAESSPVRLPGKPDVVVSSVTSAAPPAAQGPATPGPREARPRPSRLQPGCPTPLQGNASSLRGASLAHCRRAPGHGTRSSSRSRTTLFERRLGCLQRAESSTSSSGS